MVLEGIEVPEVQNYRAVADASGLASQAFDVYHARCRRERVVWLAGRTVQ